MATLVRQSTAVNVGFGPFVDREDGGTPEVSLSISLSNVRLKKNDGNWAQKHSSGSVTHEEDGWYEVPLDTGDTDVLGQLIVKIHDSGALPVWREFQVVPANVYDALVAGVQYLFTDVVNIQPDKITSTAIQDGALTLAKFASGVNVTQIVGDTGAATRLQQTFANGFNDTGVNDRLGRILADTDTGLKDEIATLDTGLRALISSSGGGEPPDTGAIAGAVWGFATRVLTSGANIALAKGVGVTGFNDLDAAGVRTAVGLASANLDTQLGTIDSNVDAILVDTDTTLPGTLSTIAGYIDTEVAAIKAVTDNLPDAGALTSLATASDLATVDSNVDAIKAVTDNLPDGGALTTLQASVNAQDTGAVASAVWGFSSRALTAFNHDTGVSSTVWSATSRTVTNVTGFSDTGVNDRLSKIGGDADTGLRDAISDARYVDTGPTADLAVLRAGVNVASIRSDTGAASRLQKLSGNQLKDDGTFDTGTGQATNTFNVQANVTLDTGTPINVQVDIPAIVSGVWGAGSRTLTDIDTGVITTGVWSASARTLTSFSHDTGVSHTVWNSATRTLTNYHDTGIDQDISRVSARVAEADTGLKDNLADLDTGLRGAITAVVDSMADTGAIASAVWAKDARTLTNYHDTGIDQSLTSLQAGVNVTRFNDTGVNGRLTQIESNTSSNSVGNAVWTSASRTLTDFEDTGTFDVLNKILGDTDTGLRAAISGIQAGGADTGAIVNAVWGAQRSAHGDTGTFGEHLGGELSASASIDTGAVANAVWGKDTRTLTNYHDTGVDQDLARISARVAEADTGLRDAITVAAYVDTGPTADLAALRSGVNVTSFADTGVNNRLARIQAETDTGLRSAIQSASYSDTGPTADLAQIVADTTTLKAGVNVTGFADTGVNNRLSRIQAEVDTGLRSHVTAAVPTANITAIKAQTDKLTFDTGNELQVDIRKVANVTVIGAGDTGAGNTWRPA